MKKAYQILRVKIIIFFVSLFNRKKNYLTDSKGRILLDSNYKLLKPSKNA